MFEKRIKFDNTAVITQTTKRGDKKINWAASLWFLAFGFFFIIALFIPDVRPKITGYDAFEKLAYSREVQSNQHILGLDFEIKLDFLSGSSINNVIKDGFIEFYDGIGVIALSSSLSPSEDILYKTVNNGLYLEVQNSPRNEMFAPLISFFHFIISPTLEDNLLSLEYVYDSKVLCFNNGQRYILKFTLKPDAVPCDLIPMINKETPFIDEVKVEMILDNNLSLLETSLNIDLFFEQTEERAVLMSKIKNYNFAEHAKLINYYVILPLENETYKKALAYTTLKLFYIHHSRFDFIGCKKS